jgi:opacity protein-like surface antigen
VISEAKVDQNFNWSNLYIFENRPKIFKMKTSNPVIFSAFLCVFALCSQSLYAQYAYVRILPGYGMSIAGSSFPDNLTIPSSGGATHELVKGSLGKGLNLGAQLGYMFTDNIGLELGFNYLLGGGVKSTYTYMGSIADDATDVYKATMMRVIPSIVISAGGETVMPYAKVGFALGVLGNMTDTYIENYNGQSSYRIQIDTYTGGMPRGVASALGVASGSGNILFFGEVSMINMSWSPDMKMMTKYEVNGVDQLALMQSWQKETDYVDTYTSPASVTGQPKKEMRFFMPMSSVGINLGVQILLGAGRDSGGGGDEDGE